MRFKLRHLSRQTVFKIVDRLRDEQHAFSAAPYGEQHRQRFLFRGADAVEREEVAGVDIPVGTQVPGERNPEMVADVLRKGALKERTGIKQPSLFIGDAEVRVPFRFHEMKHFDSLGRGRTAAGDFFEIIQFGKNVVLFDRRLVDHEGLHVEVRELKSFVDDARDLKKLTFGLMERLLEGISVAEVNQREARGGYDKRDDDRQLGTQRQGIGSHHGRKGILRAESQTGEPDSNSADSR